MNQFLSKLRRRLNPDRAWTASVKPVIFALGFLLATILENPASIASVITSILTIASGVVVAIATYFLLDEARKTREVQSAPNISVSFTQPDRNGVIYLLIKNDGPGIARNIKFFVVGNMRNHRGIKLSETSYMKQGINYLVPNQQLRVAFATNTEIAEQTDASKIITISANYESEDGKQYKKEFLNDFSMLKNVTLTEQPLEKIGRELEGIRKIVTTLEERTG